MIYKVYYQEHAERNPKRETTLSLYVNANSLPEARTMVENNTNYNIEFVQELSEQALEYEQQNPNYKVTTF